MGTRVPDRKKDFLSGAFFFLYLSDLLHEVAHGGSRLVLLLASGVGVGAQGETGVEVAQHGGYCFHIHTFATTALQNGVDVKTVSSMPGHFDAGFTLRTYTHATRQKQDEAAAAMGSFMEQVL